MNKITDNEKETLKGILNEANLDLQDHIYRYTAKDYIQKDSDGNSYLLAKDDPTDMIIDQYHGHYHTFIAREVGKGLSFLKKRLPEYDRKDRLCVRVTIGDLLKQGGLMYKVSSLPAYVKAFYFTLPEGKVLIEKE